MVDINFKALDHAMSWFRQNGEGAGRISHYTNSEYRNWLEENWGISHGTTYINIVDEEKYTLFLLRWA
jgi:hypothetical protein